MNIRNIEHIGIDTADTEETVKFYSEVLGLELLGEKDLGGDCASYMKINEDSVLELFRPQKTAGCEKHTGVRHIAFAVDDLNGWYQKLNEKNVEIVLEPTEIGAIQKKVLLFRAPDNVIVELTEEI